MLPTRLSLTQPTILALEDGPLYLGESSVVGSSPETAVTSMVLRAWRDFSLASSQQFLESLADRRRVLGFSGHLFGDVDVDAIGVVELKRVFAADDPGEPSPVRTCCAGAPF